MFKLLRVCSREQPWRSLRTHRYLTPMRRHSPRSIVSFMRTTQCFVRPMALLVAAVFLTAFACSTPMSSSGSDAAKHSAEISEADVRRLLGALSDDSLEGRMTASRGSARAAAIIAAEMRRVGLEPAGDSGYFQRVPIALVVDR